MADETTNLSVPASTWTLAAAGAGVFLLTGSDNWEYAYATAAPAAAFVGHFIYAQTNEVVSPTAGQSVYVRSPRAMRLAVTPAVE